MRSSIVSISSSNEWTHCEYCYGDIQGYNFIGLPKTWRHPFTIERYDNFFMQPSTFSLAVKKMRCNYSGLFFPEKSFSITTSIILELLQRQCFCSPEPADGKKFSTFLSIDGVMQMPLPSWHYLNSESFPMKSKKTFFSCLSPKFSSSSHPCFFTGLLLLMLS